MKRLLLLFSFLIIGILILSGCRTKRLVTMSSMRPAEITFPSYVNTILLLDRTKFESSTKNILEGILTGELPEEDKAGLQATMSALQSTLRASPRFQVKTATETYLGNSITSAFPTPLAWDKIESICAQYQTEAIIAIEIFDTDFIVTNGQKKVKKKVKQADGVEKEIEVDEYYAEGIGNVKVGFRLYDPKAKSIIDQQLFTRTNTWHAKGNSIQDAVIHLIAKKDAAQHVSTLAANSYAYKIAPMPIYITREFWVKSKTSDHLVIGARHADVNDWKQAIYTWENGLPHCRNDKDAGRICYNIAIGYEVLGELDKAKEWAGKSYVKYGNKKARDYSSMLDWRKKEEEIVKQQMK
jgi:hypothetical protein